MAQKRLSPKRHSSKFATSYGRFLLLFKGYRASHQNLDRLEDALYDCEAVLMEEPLFKKFNDELTAYVSGAGKAFDIARKDGVGARPIIEATYATAKELGDTFSRGIRILERAEDHDEFGLWEQEYWESKVKAYNKCVREYTPPPLS